MGLTITFQMQLQQCDLKEKNDKMGFIKMKKTSARLKTPIRECRVSHELQDKFCETSHKGLVSKVCKELLTLSNKKTI